MSKNCPFCPPEGQYEAWGFSPEGWQSARENHDKGHTIQVNQIQVCQHEWYAIAAPVQQCSKCQMMKYF